MKCLVREFVEICSNNIPIKEPIYEFGSRQVAGQNSFADLRPFFQNKKYIGADIISGLGVDILLDLHRLDLPDNSVGTAICVETLEHVEKPWIAIEQIRRVLIPNGVFILSIPFWGKIHDYPNDYWRLTPACLQSLLSDFPKSFVTSVGNEKKPHSILALAYGKNYELPRQFSDEVKKLQIRWKDTDHTPQSHLKKLKHKIIKKFNSFLPRTSPR